MPADLLKTKIASLPANLFAQAWTCIDEIDGALGRAGPVALLALKYSIARHEEQVSALVSALVSAQEVRIKHLQEDLRNNAVNVAEFNRLNKEYQKTYAKLQRLKKKSK